MKSDGGDMNTAIEKLKKNDENFININLFSNETKQNRG